MNTLSPQGVLKSMTEGFIQREIETIERLYKERDYHQDAADRCTKRIESCGKQIEIYNRTLETL